MKIKKLNKILQSFGFNSTNGYYYADEYSNIGKCLTILIDSKNEVKYIDFWVIGIDYDSICDVIVYNRKNIRTIKNITKKKLKNILTDYIKYLNKCIKKGKEMKIQNKIKNIENDFK